MKEECSGRPRMKVINCRQMLMRAVDVEELVEADHPVRAIWALVGQLDLSRFYREIEGVEGLAGADRPNKSRFPRAPPAAGSAQFPIRQTLIGIGAAVAH